MGCFFKDDQELLENKITNTQITVENHWNQRVQQITNDPSIKNIKDIMRIAMENVRNSNENVYHQRLNEQPEGSQKEK